jgi:hypothetical protein
MSERFMRNIQNRVNYKKYIETYLKPFKFKPFKPLIHLKKNPICRVKQQGSTKQQD